jgi:hypothetical protein
LTGLDQLLVPTAQTSFNYMLIGLFLGLGAAVVYVAFQAQARVGACAACLCFDEPRPAGCSDSARSGRTRLPLVLGAGSAEGGGLQALWPRYLGPRKRHLIRMDEVACRARPDLRSAFKLHILARRSGPLMPRNGGFPSYVLPIL